MDVLESYKIQVSFDSVRYLIENKQFPINENGKANIERSISFLNNVTQSIDSLNTPKSEEKAYYFTPKLKDIISIRSNKAVISKRDLNDSRNYFNEIKTQLEIMMVDPKKIYVSQKESDKLMSIISSIIDVYTENPYVVENDFNLSETIRFNDL